MSEGTNNTWEAVGGFQPLHLESAEAQDASSESTPAVVEPSDPPHQDQETESEWRPPPVVLPKVEDEEKVPESVRAEEAFLDAVVSHIDEDRSDLEMLRGKVSAWYDELDGVSQKPR